MKHFSIVIPTINEADNIPILLQQIAGAFRSLDLQPEVLVVDDGSTDGTRLLVAAYHGELDVRLICRDCARGLTGAVVTGALEASYEGMVIMDADLSHPVEIIPALIEPFLAGTHDIIEHKQANGALQKAHNELQLRVEERTKELAVQNQHLLNEIKERKKAEEKLQRSSEKIKLFAYSVAHDLKNPAIATHNLARILNKKFGDALTDRGKNICEQIQRSSEDIASLADKINIFISTKETPLDIKKISLKEVFQILKEEFSSQLNIRSIQWLIPGTIPDIIVADRLSIVRIFRNIIENSLKYGGDGLGKIEIGYRSTDDVHIFTVTDDGQGLTVEDSNNIFDWFKRKTTSTEIHGTGMGLAIVKEIAALHGGAVWQEPTKSKGVTFCVSLSRHLIPTIKEGVQD